MRYRFTEREIENALNKMIIIIDSREQKASSYKSEWDRNQVRYYSTEEYKKYNKECKIPKKDLFEANLPAGDYSAMIPKGTLEGINRALWFDKYTIVEKKGSINELAGNIKVTNGEKKRLDNEFARLKANGTKHRILIEDALYFKHMYEGTGDHKHGWKSSVSLLGAIDRSLSEWGTELIPVPKEYMAKRIYAILRNDVRTCLREHFEIKDINKFVEVELNE